MAWIQVDAGIREHDKIFNLADTLKIPDAHAVGLMICLWTWAVTAAPDGDITKFPPRAIAKAAGWDKKPEVFIDAICSPSSLFVENHDGRLVFRNWDERAALLMDAVERGREQTKKRVQRYRDRKAGKQSVTGNVKSGDNVMDGNDDVTGYGNGEVTENYLECNATVTHDVPDVTPLPNQTIPNHNSNYVTNTPLTPPQAGEATAVKTDIQSKRFSEFWSEYPKKVGKEAAWKSWKKIKPTAELFSRILESVSQAKQSEQWCRENGRFIPNPATWLNQGRWDDELPTAKGGTEHGNTDESVGNNRHGFDPKGMSGFHNALDRYTTDEADEQCDPVK